MDDASDLLLAVAASRVDAVHVVPSSPQYEVLESRLVFIIFKGAQSVILTK